MQKKPVIKQKDYVEMEGVVTHCFGNTMFRVRLKNGFRAMVHLSGKIRRFKIKVALQDRVVVHLSPYDLTRGRIVYRFLDPIPVIDQTTFSPIESKKKNNYDKTKGPKPNDYSNRSKKTTNFSSKKP